MKVNDAQLINPYKLYNLTDSECRHKPNRFAD